MTWLAALGTSIVLGHGSAMGNPPPSPPFPPPPPPSPTPPTPAPSTPASSAKDETTAKHVKASLVSEETSLEPGATILLGVRFKIEDGWHIYWNGLNDTGTPPVIELTAPEGFEVQPVIWPAPKRHIAPGDLLDHIYEGEVLLMIPVKVPSSAARGSSVTFTAKAKWLVCNEMCVPEEADLTLKLPIAAQGAPRKASPDLQAFAETRRITPRDFASAQPDISIAWNGPSATIASKTAAAMEFYPLEGGSEIESLLTSGASSSSTLTLTTSPAQGASPKLDGVLGVRYGKKWAYFRVQEPAKASAAQPASATDKEQK